MHTQECLKPCSRDFYAAVTELRTQLRKRGTRKPNTQFIHLVHSSLAFGNNMIERHERIRFNES